MDAIKIDDISLYFGIDKTIVKWKAARVSSNCRAGVLNDRS